MLTEILHLMSALLTRGTLPPCVFPRECVNLLQFVEAVKCLPAYSTVYCQSLKLQSACGFHKHRNYKIIAIYSPHVDDLCCIVWMTVIPSFCILFCLFPTCHIIKDLEQSQVLRACG